MCTVSWLRQAEGYELLCNRDERHTRKPAGGPRISKRICSRHGPNIIWDDLTSPRSDRQANWEFVENFGIKNASSVLHIGSSVGPTWVKQ